MALWVRDSPGRNDTCCNWLGFQITKPSMNHRVMVIETKAAIDSISFM